MSFELTGDFSMFDRLNTATRGAIVKAIELTAEQAVSIAKINLKGSISFGTLQKSVTRTTAAGGQTLSMYQSVGGDTIKAPDTGENEIAATVGTPYMYGAALENGTRPHMPPIAPIIAWINQKGIAGSIKNGRRSNSKKQLGADTSVAWAIAMSIKAHGTKPKPWLFPAINSAVTMFPRFIAQTFKEIKVI